MTGGYQLLVPAALAVIISYIIQSTLSSRLKYRSLYEAQVETRVESPAHHVEHLKGALRLLSEGRLTTASALGNVALNKVMASGVTLELPDRLQLCMESVTEQGPLDGKSLNERDSAPLADCQPILVVRDGHVILPDAKVRLKAGDELLLMASKDHCRKLKEALSVFAT